MPVGEQITTVSQVHDDGSHLFTATDEYGIEQEFLLVPCEESVRAYVNRCTHEAQRLDVGRGAAMRDGQIICPRHGSMFDACSGECDNGEAAGTALPDVEVTVEDGDVYLADDDYDYAHDGGADEGDDGSSSTSHIGF